jgi:phage terminase large subunit-like protein
MMGLDAYFEITENTLKCINGSEFLLYGAKSYYSFKSLQGITLCWIDEATEISEPAWDILIPTIRTEESRFIICFNPEKETDWVYQNFILSEYQDSVVVKLDIEDNLYFPDVLRRQLEWDKEHNIGKYLHIWQGELIQDIEGALWNKNLIKYEITDNFDKIIVAIDPSVTSTGKQDECGIIVAGIKDKLYYIIEDGSGLYSPEQWATKAVSLYDKYKADHIVYETNQGGDLVKVVINNIKPIRCVGVHASRGKIIRAEPILLLYEQDKVRHFRAFTDLEYEMVTYTGDKKDKSPNRLDALVWALTDLSQIKRAPRGMVRADLSNMNQEMRVGTMTPRQFGF